jgi:L-asparaginase II
LEVMNLLAHVVRGELSESRHYGYIAIADAQGRLLYSSGPQDGEPSFLRSSAKPFQAVALVESGAADRFGLSTEELSVACASHNGEDRHVRVVRGMLERAGLSPDQLLCGSHLPMDEPSAHALIRAGLTPSNLHSNCSGKHTGMLLTCLQMGWPTENYNLPEHPLQKWLLEIVAEFCGMEPAEVKTGMDGCSVVCFGMTTHQMATGFARLADPNYWEEIGNSKRAATVRRITNAMMSEPFMVGGTGRADTDLMEIGAGHVFSKGGAEAVWCVGFPDKGLGLAMKVVDGAARSHPAVLVEALRQTKLLEENQITEFAARQVKPLRNVRGLVIGEYKAAFKLLPPD